MARLFGRWNIRLVSSDDYLVWDEMASAILGHLRLLGIHLAGDILGSNLDREVRLALLQIINDRVEEHESHKRRQLPPPSPLDEQQWISRYREAFDNAKAQALAWR